MEAKINREELPEIVAETARLDADDEIPLSEAKQILRELDLPDERIEEARRTIAARHTKRTARRRALAIGAAALLVTVLGVTAVAMKSLARAHTLETMTVSAAGLTLHGSSLPAAVPRASAPELSFNVVLANAPHSPVALTCDWTGPDGKVTFQNRWETRPIDRDAWPTHCRHAFSANEPAGPWSVAMKQDTRVVASGTFVLE